MTNLKHVQSWEQYNESVTGSILKWLNKTEYEKVINFVKSKLEEITKQSVEELLNPLIFSKITKKIASREAKIYDILAKIDNAGFKILVKQIVEDLKDFKKDEFNDDETNEGLKNTLKNWSKDKSTKENEDIIIQALADCDIDYFNLLENEQNFLISDGNPVLLNNYVLNLKKNPFEKNDIETILKQAKNDNFEGRMKLSEPLKKWIYVNSAIAQKTHKIHSRDLNIGR
jgi:DNA topoisomerase VI subunit B